jgi:hypothetical protein
MKQDPYVKLVWIMAVTFLAMSFAFTVLILTEVFPTGAWLGTGTFLVCSVLMLSVAVVM